LIQARGVGRPRGADLPVPTQQASLTRERAPLPLPKGEGRGEGRTALSQRERQRRPPRFLSSLAFATLLACGSEAPPPAPTLDTPSTPAPPTPTAPTPAPTVLEGLDDPPPVPDEPAAITGTLTDVTPSAHACALLSATSQRLFENASSVDVLDDGNAFVVAGYLGTDPETVGIARIVPGSPPQLLASAPLEGHLAAERRTAPPILARLGETQVGLGVVDAAGRVQLATFDPTLPAPAIRFVEIATGSDPRFPPAIAPIDAGRVVAYTDASSETSHVRVAVLDAPGAITARHDVTPEAGAAAAPIFGPDGALYTIDARVAISVVHRVAIAADGTPATPTVVRPLNLAAEPPAFAVIGSSLAYAAVGNMATRAVGLLRIGTDDRATPLVPGLGYGSPLTIDAVAMGSGGIFAMEAPSAVTADAPHETRVRVVATDGAMGEPLVIGGATGARIARTRGGVVAIAVRGGTVYFARCAE
jgi:hypothetical protein